MQGDDGLHVRCVGVVAFALHGGEELGLGGVDPVSGCGVVAGVDFVVGGGGGGGGSCFGGVGGAVVGMGEGAGDGGDFAGGGEGGLGLGARSGPIRRGWCGEGWCPVEGVEGEAGVALGVLVGEGAEVLPLVEEEGALFLREAEDARGEVF